MLSSIFLYLCIGAVAGVLAGLLGVGGGLVIVPLVTYSFVFQGIDANLPGMNGKQFAVHLETHRSRFPDQAITADGGVDIGYDLADILVEIGHTVERG